MMQKKKFIAKLRLNRIFFSASCFTCTVSKIAQPLLFVFQPLQEFQAVMQIRIFWKKSTVNQENSIYNFPSVRLYLHHSLLQIERPSLYLEYHPKLKKQNKL